MQTSLHFFLFTKKNQSMSSLQIVAQNKAAYASAQHDFSFKDIDKLVVPLSDCIRIIPINTIEFLQGSSNYTVIHFTDGTKLIASKTLKSLSSSLSKTFVRTHKSFVVNLSYIQSYHFRNGTITMESSKVAMVSRSNKAMMKTIIK